MFTHMRFELCWSRPAKVIILDEIYCRISLEVVILWTQYCYPVSYYGG